MCLLSNDIYEYYYIAQGKTTIPNVDDGEELQLTDVSETVYPEVTARYMNRTGYDLSLCSFW